MANRPVFLPSDRGLVEIVDVEFEWFAGLSVAQKQKSVSSLHLAASKALDTGVGSLLEISSKSKEVIGVELSAFNLKISLDDGAEATVESAFQGSKVFEHGGPYRDLIRRPSREAKKDERIKQSGRLLRFNSNGMDWDLDPPSAFYDWIYINALYRHPTLIPELTRFAAFTDIEFNPKKQISCQAYSAALCVSLLKRDLLEETLCSPASYLSVIRKNRNRI